jgi:hypothetical protein
MVLFKKGVPLLMPNKVGINLGSMLWSLFSSIIFFA